MQARSFELVPAQEVTMDRNIIALLEPRLGTDLVIKPAAGGYGGSTTAIVENSQGGRVFVKATPNKAGGNRKAARREAAIGPHLEGVAPKFLFHVEDHGWLVTVVEALDARPTDLAPGSPDLGPAISAVDRIYMVGLPAVAEGWDDTRWDQFADQQDLPYLRGDSLTHADMHGRNILLDGGGRGWVVDWEWPTRASAALMPTMLGVQLVSAGHTPSSALGWVSRLKAWDVASVRARQVCSAVNARKYAEIARSHPEEGWLQELSEAATAWAEHLGGR